MTNRINKKIYHLIVEKFENEIESEFEVIGSSKEVMTFMKQFKDKKLNFKVNELLNSKEIKIEHKNKSKNQTYKIRKIEYRRIWRIDPERTNLKGENIEEKRRNQRLNITSETEIKEKISNLANKLIEYLYMSKDFKEELKKLEIKRLQSDSLYKDYIHHEKDIDCMDLGSSILYRIKINSLGTIDVELQNSKIESIQIIYKEIANFKIFKYALFFNPKPITNINQVIIANPKEKLKEFTQFCNEVKNRYKE